MIPPEKLIQALKLRGIGLFAGVPDSLLKSFCAWLEDHAAPGEHVIAANEGNAVALAAGYHLATGRRAAVYLQNSGLGNAVNPLVSLAASEVYRIPMLLLIGWRGEPGRRDEPQHLRQGRITVAQLQLLDVPCWVLHADVEPDASLVEMFHVLDEQGTPVALLVRQGVLAEYQSCRRSIFPAVLKREEVLRRLLVLADPRDLIVATTGKTSRELFELRAARRESQRDFLTVGSMGHASSIALGVALGNPGRRVICLDGDGALLMHLGALPVIGGLKPANIVHVLLNNAAHESVGGQPTVAGAMDFAALASACGYGYYGPIGDLDGLENCWRQIAEKPGPILLEIRICLGSRQDLGRPTSTPEENKKAFMEHACVCC